MGLIRRVALFLATNMAVLLLLGIVLSVLQRVFGIQLQDQGVLLLMAAIFGFGGSIISLLLSKTIAKATTRAYVIQQPRNEVERWLFDTVQRQAQQLGITMPEVAIYEAPDVNAFATGASRNNALVAVSTGLLRTMDKDEAEAVLGHEMSHVANGDMVTMALIQGVLNTFVFFLARLLGRSIDAMLSGGRNNRQQAQGPSVFYFFIVMALELAFGLLASMIAMAFSRWREFRADAGGARLAGREKMIAALQRLALNQRQSTLPGQMRAFGISGAIGQGLRHLLMSHPPLEARIARLRQAAG